MEESPSIKILLTFGYDMESNSMLCLEQMRGGWVNKCIKARCGKSINNMPDVVVGIRVRKLQALYQQREQV
jgi:hypothetical protein